ncbi:RNA-binding S4 domain-containing protein [Candidatus Caldatribacterium sp. SIUC1]|uniref:RNA-binding S4 domain-containing protein n=1 Tax=Candidatus Caldatribacterium californiense TaxID=1454726 RepID=A0A7V3YN74_9BACT
MRLDKFLKVSRLIKRRPVAQLACRSERVLVNGRVAKPAYQVKVGDLITLRSPEWEMTVEVLALAAPRGEEESMYRVVKLERKEEEW